MLIEMPSTAPGEGAGQGAGNMLCDALEKLAAARSATELTVAASDTARGFFEQRGFAARTRNTVFSAGNGSPTPRWSSRSPRLFAAKRSAS